MEEREKIQKGREKRNREMRRENGGRGIIGMNRGEITKEEYKNIRP